MKGMAQMVSSIKGALKSKQLEDRLRALIAAELKPGEALMPELRLAEAYGVGRVTVRRAIQELEREGLLERVQGKGTFVVDGARRAAATLNLGLALGRAGLGNHPKRRWRWKGSRTWETSVCPVLETDLVQLERVVVDEEIDLVYLNESMVSPLANRKVLAPLDSLLSRSKMLDANLFEGNILDSMSSGGKIYALPITYSPLAFFYNEDMFDARGVDYPDQTWGWGKMLDAALRLTGTFPDIGEGMVYGLGLFPVNLNMAMAFVRQNGGELLDETGRCRLDSPEAVEAIQFCAELINKHRVTPSVNAVTPTMTLPEMFRRGHLAMFVGFYDDYLWLKDNCPFRWDVAELPMGRRRASPLAPKGGQLRRGAKGKARPLRLWRITSPAEGMRSSTPSEGSTPSRAPRKNRRPRPSGMRWNMPRQPGK